MSDRVVLADGCFDPLHVGHLRYLRSAAAFGTLHVRVAPDAVIRAKGRECFQSAAERADCIAAVVPCRTWFNSDLAAAVRELKPDLLVKGIDWHGKLPAEVLAACAEQGTAIIYVQTQERSSSERLQG